MEQIAVFVDAGYLIAAGANLLAGGPQPRSSITLEIETVVQALKDIAHEAAPASRLLRIYWYDGVALHSGPNAEQNALGFSHNIKLRLGTINSRGQQKGVDSLIITDLIDLSRNKAITDALVVAGDEDLRVGIQVAQTYGVRVALLGIAPSRGNQSPQLMQEADATHEWNEQIVAQFIRTATQGIATEGKVEVSRRPQLEQPSSSADFASIIQDLLQQFDEEQISQFQLHLNSTKSLPREIDAPLLGRARDNLGRDLTVEEKRNARRIAREKLS